ncbi:plasmid segregation protein ParM domain-containing protein [Vibrio sp. 10N.261.46.A3]|uniref:plasmid segregation protein ParM domain-containing protein n=1 Tax=Vibrio sp. 10N.261.46.A3 TaxID=3229658 RepID=UPI00354DF95D
MQKIMIDDGSNYVKLCFKSGDVLETQIIPSRVIRKALPSMSMAGFSDASYEIDGEKYSFSSTATGVIPTNNQDYQVALHNRVLINHALKKAGVIGDVEVVTTLPVGQFFNVDGSRNDELIARKISNVKAKVKHLDGSEGVDIKSCYVLPEGVPAFVFAKQELGLTGGRFLMVDIGGTTTDILIINGDDQIENFKSVNVGALKMLSEFSTLVCSKLQLSELTDELTIEGLLSGVVVGVDVSDFAKQVIKSFESMVNESISDFGELKLFDAVIFSGGGANLLNSSYIQALKTKDPQLDNVKGAQILLGGGL